MGTSVSPYLAALLGDDVYNFAELLAHPIVTALPGTAFAWLQEVVTAFNDGGACCTSPISHQTLASLFFHFKG